MCDSLCSRPVIFCLLINPHFSAILFRWTSVYTSVRFYLTSLYSPNRKNDLRFEKNENNQNLHLLLLLFLILERLNFCTLRCLINGGTLINFFVFFRPPILHLPFPKLIQCTRLLFLSNYLSTLAQVLKQQKSVVFRCPPNFH